MGIQYEGWIKPKSTGKKEITDEKKFLEGLGITIGRFNPKTDQFEECIVPASIHAQLTMLQGRFEMDLEAVKTDEPDEPEEE